MAEEPRTLVETYAQTSETTRATARWVITTLGGVGALLVAGLGLSSLSGVESEARLVLAAGFVVVALAGVGWGIAQTAAVLKSSSVKFEDLVAAEQDTSKKKDYMKEVFERKEVFLQALADSFAALQQAFRTTQQERAAAWKDAYANPGVEAKEKAAEAKEQLMAFHRSVMLSIVANAAARQIASRAKTWKQLVAAGLVVVGVIGFALTVAWPTADDRTDFRGSRLAGTDLNGVRLTGASFEGVTLTGVRFVDADLRNVDFSGATLESVSLFGAKLEGASFDGTKWVRVTCPDGTLSDRAGGTCTAHLESAAGDSAHVTARCRDVIVAGDRECIGLNRLCTHTRRANRIYRRFGLNCGRRVAPGRYRLVPG